jgi:hypothetical protein
MGIKLTSTVVKIRTPLTAPAIIELWKNFRTIYVIFNKFQDEKLCTEICHYVTLHAIRGHMSSSMHLFICYLN